MKTPRRERGQALSRTLQGLKEDHHKFLTAGGNVKRAKFFNNAMSPLMFDLEIEQVIIIIIM